MDTRWFEGKLTLNAEYFRENRTNILKTPSRTNIISGVTSFSPQNLMEVKNQGVEVEVGWDHKIKDFGYRIKANIAYNHNEIIEQNEQIRKYPYMNRRFYRTTVLTDSRRILQYICRNRSRPDAIRHLTTWRRPFP